MVKELSAKAKQVCETFYANGVRQMPVERCMCILCRAGARETQCVGRQSEPKSRGTCNLNTITVIEELKKTEGKK